MSRTTNPSLVAWDAVPGTNSYV